MRIGQLAGRSNASIRALRYYEEVGLLTPRRGPNGYRQFSEGDVARVWQIQWLFTAGLCSSKIATVLPLVCGDHAAVVVDGALAEEVADTRRLIADRVAELTGSLARLDAVIAAARANAAG